LVGLASAVESPPPLSSRIHCQTSSAPRTNSVVHARKAERKKGRQVLDLTERGGRERNLCAAAKDGWASCVVQGLVEGGRQTGKKRNRKRDWPVYRCDESIGASLLLFSLFIGSVVLLWRQNTPKWRKRKRKRGAQENGRERKDQERMGKKLESRRGRGDGRKRKKA